LIEKVYIAPKDLRAYWDYLRPKLELVLQKSPEQWIPEDIYADILIQNSLLWIVYNKQIPSAFVVVQKQDLILHLWAGYSGANVKDQEQWNIIEEIAKELKCTKITFGSWRKGWSRKARKFGFQPYKYFKELEK